MQDRELLETYCKEGSWNQADTWLCKELVFVHSRVVRRRICTLGYGILLTLVLMGITWGAVFPGCNDVDNTKFPFSKAANAVWAWLRPMIPVEGGGGNAIAFLGLFLLPLVAWGLLSLFTCLINPKKYAKKKGVVDQSYVVRNKIELLDKLYSKHNNGHMDILLPFWLLSAVGGWIMAMCASTSPENFGRYLFVGLICAGMYALCFFGGIAIVSWFYEGKSMPYFSPYDYYDEIRRANGEYVPYSSDDDTPPTPHFELDEETIQTILDDVYGDCGGKYGNY